MLTYNDIYEILRKEKYNEVLQPLPKSFIEEAAAYLHNMKEQSMQDDRTFDESMVRNKKQLENSFALFKEIVMRRKKKMLNLVFVAGETGIMKKDYECMLPYEQEMFDSLVKVFEAGDKALTGQLHGKQESPNKMIIFTQNVEQFVDMTGGFVGPFISGELANLDVNVSQVLVSGGKASFVDD